MCTLNQNINNFRFDKETREARSWQTASATPGVGMY